MLLIGTGMFFDGFDIYVAATVLGATLKSGFSTMGQNAQFMSVTFVGMMLGSFLTGFLGDRYGRRFTYQANLAIFGLASIASAFAPSMAVLTLLRFIMGVGLGAENVVGYSTMTEFVPPQARGKWLGGMNVIVVSGLPTAALLGTFIIRTLDGAPCSRSAEWALSLSGIYGNLCRSRRAGWNPLVESPKRASFCNPSRAKSPGSTVLLHQQRLVPPLFLPRVSVPSSARRCFLA
jgi:MFS family permease